MKKIIIEIIAAVFLIVLGIMYYKKINEVIDLQRQLVLKDAGIKQLQNKQGELISQIPVAITTNLQQVKDISQEYFKTKPTDTPKRIDEFGVVTQKASIGATVIPFDTTSVLVFSEEHFTDKERDLGDSLIRVPQKFYDTADGLNYIATVKADGIHRDTAYLENKIAWRFGDVKRGFLFFGKSTYELQVYNTNKIFSNDKIEVIKVKPKASLWNTWIKPALCIAAGYLIATNK